MSKAIQFKNKGGEKIYPCAYMPIGSIYKSFNNTNPSVFFGGTWTLMRNAPSREFVGSQQICGAMSGSGNVGKTNITGAYNYETINGVFENISVPSGYHREYRITFQGRTGGDNKITIYLNNIATNSRGTWSAESFRVIGGSNYFKESDITLETTMGYSGKGCNLKYQVSGTANAWNIYSITVQGYLTSDNIIYEWKRTS